MDPPNFFLVILELNLFKISCGIDIMINFIDGRGDMPVLSSKSVTISGQIMVGVSSRICVVEIEKLSVQPKYVVHKLLS